MLAGISVLAPNSPTLYTCSGTPAHECFLWPGPVRGTGIRVRHRESRDALAATLPYSDFPEPNFGPASRRVLALTFRGARGSGAILCSELGSHPGKPEQTARVSQTTYWTGI